jgi:hypothetical protein
MVIKATFNVERYWELNIGLHNNLNENGISSEETDLGEFGIEDYSQESKKSRKINFVKVLKIIRKTY